MPPDSLDALLSSDDFINLLESYALETDHSVLPFALPEEMEILTEDLARNQIGLAELAQLIRERPLALKRFTQLKIDQLDEKFTQLEPDHGCGCCGDHGHDHHHDHHHDGSDEAQRALELINGDFAAGPMLGAATFIFNAMEMILLQRQNGQLQNYAEFIQIPDSQAYVAALADLYQRAQPQE